MSKYVHSLLILLCTALASCSSLPLTQLKLPEPTERAEILVFREYAFNAGGVTLTFGANHEAYVKLDNSEFATFFLQPNTYRFFVQARNGDPTTITTTLKVGERKCLKTVAGPINLAKVILPIVMMTSGYSFELEEVKCPSNGDLAKYSRVPVNYLTK